MGRAFQVEATAVQGTKAAACLEGLKNNKEFSGRETCKGRG